MATQGSPGRIRIARNTMLMAPSSMGTAISRRCNTYWNMPTSVPSVEHLEHLRIVVAVVQRKLAVVGRERGAHPLGIARPLVRHILERQAHQVSLEPLLRLGVDRGPLLHVTLHAPGVQQVVHSLVVGEVGPFVRRYR